MEFYFTDRSFHLLGIATAGSDHTNDFRISGEIERTNVDAAMVAFTGTLYFPKKQLSKAEAMFQDLNYMLYMDDDGNGRMITITASHADGTGYCIAFEGTDAGNDLKNEIVDAYTATTQMTFEQYFNIFTGNSGWDIGVNEIPTDVRTLTFDSEETSYDRMNSVATQFGVETYFSFSIVGTTMVKCYLNVVKKRGADRGITLRVGDEINRITVDSDSTNLMTAVYARGATPDGSETPINLVGYSYTDPTGQFVLTKEGYLLDTVSNRIYSRLRQNSTATVDGSYLNHVIDYEATTQASLLQSALEDLKQNNHPAVNYTIELAKIPQNIRCGDTVQIEQEDRQLYLSARVLELDKCYSNPSSSTMVMGDYLLETSQVAKQYQDLAQKLKDIPKTIQYYPWIRYADDDQGTNMSALPAGKKYMAVVYSNKSSVPSDNQADYAGKWALIQGNDGADGKPGPAGTSSYLHTAYANSIDGSQDFSTTDGNGKSYFGQYVDQTQADSTDPTKYSWALFKGTDGRDGKDGSDNVPVITVGTTYPTGPKKGDMHWLTNSSGVVTGYYTYDGSSWQVNKVDASVISAETFNGMTFNGVTFTGSKFISSFTGVKPDGVANYTVHGTTTMASGSIVTDTYSDANNSQITHTELNQFGLLSNIYNNGTLMGSVQATLGTLTLGSNYQATSSSPVEWITSSLDALRVLQLTNNNLLVWHGAFYPAQDDTATISTPLSKTLSGWLIAWSYYQNGAPTYNNYAFTLLPKAALIYNTTGANYLRVTFTMKNVGTIFKVLWYDDTHIIGADENKGGSLAQAVMTEVYAV
ncbi:phage tail protein [Lacticaseibacillus paracasei]|uniref:phage tail protein n=1 Tax=Lacticaseibacillus paracasei TaxID=1597 RepID=UPI0021A65B95|nr:phage tail protein [Lacticaseibacillus paracasei]UWP75577.1 phage tail protein [Lacticaseibacillus paracasei]